jgi:hypothetical protein
MFARRIKPVPALILTFLLALLFMSFASAQAFSDDLEAIDNAAKSVLLLVVYDSEGNIIATGSGFVAFDCETLVTNNHVIEGADLILAISDAGYEYMVTKVIAADAQRDIALLEFMSPTDMAPLQLFEGEEGLKRGAPVVAIGSPEAVKNTVSMGNISALYDEEGVRKIQFTAPISHGSSGGALFNNFGQVIGITSSGIEEGQNLNQAIEIGEIIRLKEAGWGNERVSFAEHWELSKLPATPTPEPLPTPEPTLVPAPTVQPNDSLEENFDLMAMWTLDGVILRWHGVKDALWYDIYRIKNGDSVYIDTVYGDATYYLDQITPLEEPICEYWLAAVYSNDGNIFCLSKRATANSPLEIGEDLTPPQEITVKEGIQEACLTWEPAQGAETYIVYRGVNPSGEFIPLAYKDAPDFQDFSARPESIYYYKIRILAGNRISDFSKTVCVQMPKNTPPPVPIQPDEPKYPLVIGEDAYVSSYLGYTKILPTLVNKSLFRTVAAYTLVYYCVDKDGNMIPHKDTGDIFYFQDFEFTIMPDGTSYPTYAWLYGYKNAKKVRVAVSYITFSDGTLIEIPFTDLDFGTWTVP